MTHIRYTINVYWGTKPYTVTWSFRTKESASKMQVCRLVTMVNVCLLVFKYSENCLWGIACCWDLRGPEQPLFFVLGWLSQKSGQVCDCGMRMRAWQDHHHLSSDSRCVPTAGMLHGKRSGHPTCSACSCRVWQLPRAFYPSAFAYSRYCFSVSWSRQRRRESLFTHGDQSRLLHYCAIEIQLSSE